MASVMPGTPGYQPGAGNPIARPARPGVSGPITPGGPGNLPPRSITPSGPGNLPPQGVGRGITPPGPTNLPPRGITPGGPGNLPPRPIAPRGISPPGMPPVPRVSGPITPPGPGNLPPRSISPPGIPPVPRGTPPAGPSVSSHGFDPNVYARGLQGSQLKDFNSLMKNTGGNFKNFGGGSGIAANLNKRYGMPQAPPQAIPPSGPINSHGPGSGAPPSVPSPDLFTTLMNRGRG